MAFQTSAVKAMALAPTFTVVGKTIFYFRSAIYAGMD
jgi:hypothetical protein